VDAVTGGLFPPVFLFKTMPFPELPPPLRFSISFHFIPHHSENTGANDFYIEIDIEKFKKDIIFHI
jgi:hypothetical protein